ncbi:MAG TPA: lysophospholipid acyltransferase family protein, partial [Oscillatoriaceae cyanobacterium]
RRLGEDLRAGWAWACFGLLAPPVWTAIALLPSLAARRRLLKTACKRLMALSGVRLRIEGLERLPAGPCVLVCNHASYMDVLLLTVALPEDIRYVAKRSFRSHWLTRLFMERLATLFVARDDPRQGLADTAPLEAALRGGDRLLIFPEGGFVRAPGLQPFRMGAFVVAADTGAPIVPVALWGTRSLLRGESWFPRPGLARMTIGAPIVPTQADWAEALRLRERAYAEILRHCGEPAVAGVPAPTGA